MKIYPVQTHYTNSNSACKPTFQGKNFAKVLDGINYNHDYSSEKWFEFFKTCMAEVVKEPGFRKIGNLFDEFSAVKKCEDLEELLTICKIGCIKVDKKSCIAKDKYGDLVFVNSLNKDSAYSHYIEFASEGKSAMFGIKYETRHGTKFHFASVNGDGVIFD